MPSRLYELIMTAASEGVAAALLKSRQSGCKWRYCSALMPSFRRRTFNESARCGKGGGHFPNMTCASKKKCPMANPTASVVFNVHDGGGVSLAACGFITGDEQRADASPCLWTVWVGGEESRRLSRGDGIGHLLHARYFDDLAGRRRRSHELDSLAICPRWRSTR